MASATVKSNFLFTTDWGGAVLGAAPSFRTCTFRAEPRDIVFDDEPSPKLVA